MLNELRRDGYAEAKQTFYLAQALRERLMQSPAFTGHVIPQGDRVERSFEDAMAQPHGFVCHRMADVLSTPNLFGAIVGFHGIAEAYFRREPILYSVNAFWKKPNGAPGWHHDTDDGPHQLVQFMYGTDVRSDAGGVHAYVTGSHLWDRMLLKPFHNVEVEVSGPLPKKWPVHKFYGEAGTTFVTDTHGLHNGFPPAKEPRLLLWARWSTIEPPSYKNDELKPVPWRQVVKEKPIEAIQKRTRLVVDWSGE